MEDVPADHGQIGRGIGDVGLLHEAVDPNMVLARHHRNVGAAVGTDFRRVHLDQGDDGSSGPGLDVDHGRQQFVPLVDQVIAQQDGERLVAHVLAGAQDRMAKPLGVSLAHVVQRAQAGGMADSLQPVEVALEFEGVFQRGLTVEVVLQRTLLAPGNHEQIGQPGPDGFFHNVLDGRLVDHRQHFLGHCLRGRQKARSQSRSGYDSLSYRFPQSHNRTLQAGSGNENASKQRQVVDIPRPGTSAGPPVSP